MRVREPVVAGTFYPGMEESLRREVTSLLEEASSFPGEREFIGGVSPHAGYIFSGRAQAFLYRVVQEREFSTVVILASSHYAFYEGASVYPEGIYLTPLGEVPVEEEISQELISKPDFSYIPQAHSREHSVEVQLPFLQIIRRDFKIVPVVISQFDLELTRRMAETIDEVTRDKSGVIFIASSDLSHYPPYEIAKKVDGEVIKRIISLDPESLHEFATLAPRRFPGVSTAICGEGAVLTLMYLLKIRKVRKGEVLIYYNSGDVEGRMRSEVVGYSAIGFWS